MDIKNNNIYNGDCLELMKYIEDNSVDLIVCDPPYKIISGGCTIEEKVDEVSGIFRRRAVSDGTNCSNKWLKKEEYDIPAAVKSGKMFKHNDIKFEEWLPEYFRILKDGTHCYLFTNDRNMQEMLNEATKVGFKLVNILVWNKNNATPNKYYMKNAEFVLLFRKGKARNINNMGTKQVMQIKNIIGNKLHPSEKPVELLEILINNSSNENDIVFDGFIGSGSTIIAAINTNRQYIGIELDKQYFDISQERINKIKEDN